MGRPYTFEYHHSIAARATLIQETVTSIRILLGGYSRGYTDNSMLVTNQRIAANYRRSTIVGVRSI
jgi:hypothetical protein